MQIQYEIPSLTSDFGDPDAEKRACREDCALFDFSFVQRARVSGPRAADLVMQFANRSIDDMAPGKIRYALRLNEDGTVVSDLTVWKISDEQFEIMSGHLPDIADLCALGGGDVTALSNDTAIFAVQGPNALLRLFSVCAEPEALARLAYFEHGAVSIAEVRCRVGRLGYTGEPGFELICSKADATHLWSMLASRCVPAGFIAADTLRIEAGFPLFWNDFALPVTPAEVGLAHFSSRCGTEPDQPLKRICFSAVSRDTPKMWRFETPPVRPTRPGEVAVTSACQSQLAKGVVGLGYVLASTSFGATQLFDPAGQFTGMRPQPLPLYDTQKTRPRSPWRR